MRSIKPWNGNHHPHVGKNMQKSTKKLGGASHHAKEIMRNPLFFVESLSDSSETKLLKRSGLFNVFVSSEISK